MTKLYMRQGATALITLAMVSAPFVASAQTTTTTTSTIAQIQAEIQSVLSHLADLRQQLASLAGAGDGSNATSTAQGGCPSLTRDLQVGAQGDDVKQLQQFLGQDPTIFQGSATGFFGPKTQQAVQQFQLKNGIASSSTGYVGARTRDFFQGHCGDANQQPHPVPPIGTTTPPQFSGDGHAPMRPYMGSTTPSAVWNGAASSTMPLRPASTTYPFHMDDFKFSTSTAGTAGGPVPPPPVPTR